MPLTRDEVVAGALGLLDRVGLEGLTLRRLGRELGVQAPTLYWHVEDKRHLLDLMVEEIYRRAEIRPAPAPGEPWWEWLASNVRAQRTALISIRDAGLVVAGNRPTERSYPLIESTLLSLSTAGVDPPTALEALRGLNDYAIGSAIEYQSMMARSTRSSRDSAAATSLREAGDYPVLRAALGGRGQSLEEIFEAGLRWMIGGLRAEVEAKVGVGG